MTIPGDYGNIIALIYSVFGPVGAIYILKIIIVVAYTDDLLSSGSQRSNKHMSPSIYQLDIEYRYCS